jgi:phytoene dehydrogenase-like protein
MGSITQALAAAGRERGVEICTSSPVAQIEVRNGRARSVVLEDGTEVRGCMILSNADPKRIFLKMLPSSDLPEDFLNAVRGIKMQGPCAKVNMVLDQEPRFTGTSPRATPLERTFYTLVPSLEFADSAVTTLPSSARYLNSFGWIAWSPRMQTTRWRHRVSTSSPALCNMFPTIFATAVGMTSANRSATAW